MLYAEILNSSIVSVRKLPLSFTMGDGRTIINFNRLSDLELKAHGFLPVLDDTPAYDSDSVGLGAPAYTVGAASVSMTHALVPLTLEQYRQKKIALVYGTVKALLNAQAEGYSQAEIATWPALQADVVAYNLDTNVIGAALQAASDTSAYTVVQIAAILTPRIAVQVSALASRKAIVAALNAATTIPEVAAVDITTGL